MSYGQVIQKLRREAGMTQSELGKQLCVSSQAVSKWENDFSQPDFSTISSLCKIFNVTVDSFAKMANDEEDDEVSITEDGVESKSTFWGVCKDCGVSVFDANRAPTPVSCGIRKEYKVKGRSRISYTIDTSRASDTLCINCNRKRKEYEQKAKEHQEAVRVQQKRERDREQKWLIFGLIMAILGAIGGLLFGLLYIKNIGAGIAIAYGIFAFVSLLGHDTVVGDILEGGFEKSFHLPGVIFELDLDGILFMLAYKFIIAPIISAILWLVFFFGAVLLAMVVAMVVFPFKIPSLISDLT